MRRTEVAVLALVAVALIVAGVTWLAGAWGLLGCGVALGACLFFVNVKE